MSTPIDTVSSISQLNVFILSVVLGAVLELIYEIFNLISTSKSVPKFIIVLNDAAFFVTAAFLTHIFLILFCSGKIRFFVILAEIIGFAVIYNSVGRLFRLVLKLFGRGMRHIFLKMKKFCRFIYNKFQKKFTLRLKIKRRIVQKHTKTCKKHLK